MIESVNSATLHGQPLEEWFFPQIDRSSLRAYMRRSNRDGLYHIGAWLALCIASGYLVFTTIGTYWILPTMTLYGSILSFSYAASHECAHGTAFGARFLNESVFWITSFIYIEEPAYRSYAHADHHTYTWFNGLDPQKAYGKPLALGRYLKETLGTTFYIDAVKRLARHSLGRFNAAEQAFLPQQERRRVCVDSLLMFACYVTLLAWGILARTPSPFVFYFIPRLAGGCFVNLYINSQHMCMAEDLKDHRMTTRSISCSPIERVLYWNMNFHIERHLFPAVPFHALPDLNARIKAHLPTPTRSVWSANREIVRAVIRQKHDPAYDLSATPRLDNLFLS